MVSRMTPPIAALGAWKATTMLGLGSALLLASEIGDPNIERYVSLGVGGLLAATIFYFYRQLVTQTIARERENTENLRTQSAVILSVVQENTRVSAVLQETVASFHVTVDTMNRDQRERYEQTLRMEKAR